jgi:hypothetical protein
MINQLKCSVCGETYQNDTFAKDVFSGNPLYYKADPRVFEGQHNLKPLAIYCSAKCGTEDYAINPEEKS